MKKLFIPLMLLFLTSCSFSGEEKTSSIVDVVVSTYPTEFLFESIGGDFVTVTNLTETAASPHFYEPTPKDILTVSNTDIFIYSGFGLDPFAESIAESSDGDVRIVAFEDDAIIQGFTIHGDEHEDEVEAEAETETGEDHDHGDVNPHIWMSVDILKREAVIVRDILQSENPDKLEVFQANYDDLVKDIDNEYSRFDQSFADCDDGKVIVSHDAFSYLFQDYNIESISISGLNPREEPTAQTLAIILDTMESNDIDALYLEETMVSSYTELLESETGATVYNINPGAVRTEEEKSAGMDYLDILESDRVNLDKGNICNRK